MAKIIINPAVIRSLTEKYVKSLSVDPAKIPDIRKVISEAIHVNAPDRTVHEKDISAVLKELSLRQIINDKTISEVAKTVMDNNAHEDLVFSIQTYGKQLKVKSSEKDVQGIIKFGKLDPYTSTPFQIKNAVRDYFQGNRPLELVPQNEIRELIRTELAKDGPIDDRDVSTVLQKYLGKADPKKPIQPDDIRDVINNYVRDTLKDGPNPPQPDPIDIPQGPQPTPLVRPETPSDASKGKKGPTPPAARQSRSTPPPVQPGEPVPPKDKKHPNFFEQVRMKMARYGIVSLSNYARNWLKDTINKAATTPSRKKLLTQGTTVHEAFIGKMFLYFYDAKLKEDLPYWDKFPLIVCVDMAENGWYGLNLHYLPFPMRIKLFDALLTIADNKSLDKIQRLKLNYGLLRGFSKFPEARPCFKRYLSNYVKSDLLRIEPVDWETAVFLPVEQFQKQTKEKVWRDSRKTVGALKKKR